MCFFGTRTKMKKVNVSTLKSKLSAYLKLVKQGKEVVVTDRNEPVAIVVPFKSASGQLETQRGYGDRRLLRELSRLPRSHSKTSAVALLLEERQKR